MKIRNLSLSLLAVSMIAFTSCKDAEEKETTPVQTEANNTANAAAPTVNPAHGLPGHRCDIPVGADLSQASNVQMQQSNTGVNPNVSPVRVNSSTATPAKNPPHGQPGHDCTKPVGADL